MRIKSWKANLSQTIHKAFTWRSALTNKVAVVGTNRNTERNFDVQVLGFVPNDYQLPAKSQPNRLRSVFF